MKSFKSKKADQSKLHNVALGRSNSNRKKDRGAMKTPNVPTELLGLIYSLLEQHGFERTVIAFESDYEEYAKSRRTKKISWKDAAKDCPSLISIFLEWTKNCSLRRSEPEISSRSSESSSSTDSGSDDMSSAESSSLTPSTSSGSSEDESITSELKSEIITNKRKRSLSSVSFSGESISISSTSASSSSKESSGTDSPRPTKRAKKSVSTPEAAVESGTNNSSLSKSRESTSTGSSLSSNGGEGSSASESSPVASRSSHVLGPDSLTCSSRSSTSSSDDSSSESDLGRGHIPRILSSEKSFSSGSAPTTSNKLSGKKRTKPTRSDELKEQSLDPQRKNSTDSSTTLLGGEGRVLNDTSTEVKNMKLNLSTNDAYNGKKPHAPLRGQGVKSEVSSIKRARKENSPFSRIPKDIKVDERFAANLYMPNAANEQVYQDLRSTKGKGFTKEKNKKKRGSRFSGGKIDIHARETLKFDS